MNCPKRTYIIAEAGVNHNGSLEIAKRLVESAKTCGADAVKFQTFSAERLVTKTAEKAEYQRRTGLAGDSQFEMLKKLELSESDFRILLDHCKHSGIEFLSSPFDEESADLLDTIGMPAFKIPSGEITNHPLLKHIARKGKPVILSTGMSSIGEVEEAIGIFNACGTPRLTLLHCVTEYPAPYAEINLSAMITLRTAFGLGIGYSDHTPGIEIALAAVALGATVIEKHFTLDNSMHGPDHQASLNPDDFQRMVQAIRNVEVAIGDGIKRPSPCELKNANVARKSVVAAQTINNGETITRDMLAIKRPGYGILPKDIEKLFGLIVNRTVEKDEIMKWDYLT